MLRGKESSNRIELSRLVQDLLNFGDLGSLWLLRVGVGGWGWGWLGWVNWGRVVGGCPPHMCTYTCMHTHMHTDACMVNMIISCKWLPPWGNPWVFPMMSYACACACACVCVHVYACMCVCTCVEAPPWMGSGQITNN